MVRVSDIAGETFRGGVLDFGCFLVLLDRFLMHFLDLGRFLLILGRFLCVFRLLQQGRIHLGVRTLKPPKYAHG